jgi:hypothetical protein
MKLAELELRPSDYSSARARRSSLRSSDEGRTVRLDEFQEGRTEISRHEGAQGGEAVCVMLEGDGLGFKRCSVIAGAVHENR